jgi:hypothetical protein
MRTIARALSWACVSWMVACDGRTVPSGPEDCAPNEVFTTQCGECGPADECLGEEPVCAPSCEDGGDSCEGGRCVDGLCKTACL